MDGPSPWKRYITQLHGDNRLPGPAWETSRTCCAKLCGNRRRPSQGWRQEQCETPVPQLELPDLGRDVVHDAALVALLMSHTS